MPPKIKRVGKYELGATLGQGTFGKVKLALDTTTNTYVAIKMMDKSKIRNAHMGTQIKKEVCILLPFVMSMALNTTSYDLNFFLFT